MTCNKLVLLTDFLFRITAQYICEPSEQTGGFRDGLESMYLQENGEMSLFVCVWNGICKASTPTTIFCFILTHIFITRL